MPDLPKNGRCPVCLKQGYCVVLAKKPDGSHRETALYSCVGCSTIFANPHDFANGLSFRTYEEKLIAADKAGCAKDSVIPCSGYTDAR